MGQLDDFRGQLCQLVVGEIEFCILVFDRLLNDPDQFLVCHYRGSFCLSQEGAETAPLRDHVVWDHAAV